MESGNPKISAAAVLAAALQKQQHQIRLPEKAAMSDIQPVIPLVIEVAVPPESNLVDPVISTQSVVHNFVNVDELRQELNDYRQLVFKGQMIDFFVAFIMGATLTNFAKSISENLIMPFVTYMLNKTGQDWETVCWEPIRGMKLETGKFGANFISLILIATLLFMAWVMVRKSGTWKQNMNKVLTWIFPWKLVRRTEVKIPERMEESAPL